MSKKSSGTRADSGQGTIYFSESRNCWIAEIHWSDNKGSHRKTFRGKKKIAVQVKLDEFKKQLLLGSVSVQNADVPFRDFAEKWMKDKESNHLKPTSYDRKMVTLTNQVYPAIGMIPINKLTSEDIQQMVNDLRDDGKSYSTISKALQAVSGVTREYRIQTRQHFNPCEGVVLPENKKKNTSDIKFFSTEECQKIVAACGAKWSNGKYIYRLGQAIVLLLYTGMRIGELIALTWDDVDMEAKTINITRNAVVVRDRSANAKTRYKTITQEGTKTGRSRVIPLSSSALAALTILKDITGNQKYVAASETGTPVNVRNFERLFSQVLKRAGVKHPCADEKSSSAESNCAGVHILRHTFASMLFANGAEVKIVSDVLGHSDTKTTENIYIHLIQEHKTKTIVDSLDKYIF